MNTLMLVLATICTPTHIRIDSFVHGIKYQKMQKIDRMNEMNAQMLIIIFSSKF